MIITGADIRKDRDLSTTSEKKINIYIKDAEISDLRPLLGEELYQDLEANPTKTDEGDYPKLLQGSTYTYGNYTYSHPGIKAVLVDFASARYRFFGSDTDTPFGVVEKQFNDGRNTSVSRNREVYGAIRKVAKDKWFLVKDYLDRMNAATATKYTYWFGVCAQIDDDQDLVNINKGTLR